MADKIYTEDDIKSISTREHVRLRPKMYFGKCFTEGSLDALPLEVACHAFDEYFDGNCSQLDIILHKDSFTIRYDAGMPLDTSHGAHTAELMMTSIFACRNHKKHLAVGREFCELGLATINFASGRSSLTTVSKGQKGTFNFEEGLISNRNTEPSAETAFTEIFLQPDTKIFGELKLSPEGVNEKVKQLNAKLEGLAINVTKRDN